MPTENRIERETTNPTHPHENCHPEPKGGILFTSIRVIHRFLLPNRPSDQGASGLVCHLNAGVCTWPDPACPRRIPGV